MVFRFYKKAGDRLWLLSKNFFILEILIHQFLINLNTLIPFYFWQYSAGSLVLANWYIMVKDFIVI